MMKNRMEEIKQKVKGFCEDTQAISPIIATILVIGVAVAAGVALYFWFDTFQTGAQGQVENTSTSSMNIMVEKSLGNDVLKVSLPVSTFEYSSTMVDVDNDGKIYRPEASGNYSDYTLQKYGYVKYKNNWRDERFIQEIPVYIKNNGPTELTGVKVKYSKLASTLNFVLRIDRDNNYQLLDINGNPVHVMINNTGVYENNSISYYFNEPSYAMNYSNITDIITDDAYLPIESSMFKDNRTTSTKLYDVDGNSRYGIAYINGVKTGWNTASSFFASAYKKGLNDTNYDWAKENLHNPVYEVGTLKPGESKKIYTYYYLAYLVPSDCTTGDSFADCTIELPITVSTDQGPAQTVIAKLHLIDEDTT